MGDTHDRDGEGVCVSDTPSIRFILRNRVRYRSTTRRICTAEMIQNVGGITPTSILHALRAYKH